MSLRGGGEDEAICCGMYDEAFVQLKSDRVC